MSELGPPVLGKAAVDAYHLADPFEEHDPYLVEYVQQIAYQSAQQ